MGIIPEEVGDENLDANLPLHHGGDYNKGSRFLVTALETGCFSLRDLGVSASLRLVSVEVLLTAETPRSRRET